MIINSGHRYYNFSKSQDSSLTESNFLKNDSNYYAIIKTDWIELSSKINTLFDEIAAFLDNREMVEPFNSINFSREVYLCFILYQIS
jgi:hypothetical protein